MSIDDIGTVTEHGEYTRLTFRRRLAHPIEAVWAAITDPAERKAWFGATTLDPRPGGTIETVADEPPAAVEAKRTTGRVLVWDPPHVFEHEWIQRIVEDSVVRYELTEDGDGTILTFTHTGLSPTNARGFAPGTHAFLDRLTAHLDDAALPGWSTRYEEVAARYPSWQ